MNKKRKLTVIVGTALCALSACVAFAACGGSNHNVTEIGAKDATCTEAGNEHYYACTDEGCGKLFSDADCKNEVTLEEVTKPALGHDPKKVEYEAATCTTDGHEAYYDCSRCELNFADAAGTQILTDNDIIIPKLDHDGIKEVPKKAPTLAEEGNVYHWHCNHCQKDFTNENATKEIENVVIPKLVKETGLTINVTTYDDPETTGTAPADKFDLKGTEYPDSDTAGISIASGKLSVTELIADSYKFEIEGYYPVYFKVEKGVKTYNLDLYKHFHTHTVDHDDNRMSYDYIDGDLKIHFNGVNRDDNTATVHFNNKKMADDGYMSQFTVKYENIADWTWTERFAIILGSSTDRQKHLGVVLYVAGSEIQVNEYCDQDPMMGEGNEYGRNPRKISGTQATAIKAALRGDGLQMRAMRSGNQLTVCALIDEEWVKIWEHSVDGLGKDFAIHASSPNCTFTVSDMKFFDYNAATQERYAHFTTGSGANTAYFETDGTETTLEKLARVAVAADFNVAVFDGLRNAAEAPATSFTLTNHTYFSDSVENVTIVGGKLSVAQLFPGKYTIEIDGYYPAEFTVARDTQSPVEIKLYKIDSRFVIDGNDSRVTPSEVEEDLQFKFDHVALNDNVATIYLKDNAITGNYYMTELTVKYSSEASWGERFAIRLGNSSNREAPLGVMFFVRGGEGQVTGNEFVLADMAMGEGGNFGRNPFRITGAQATALKAALEGDGLQIRAMRVGSKLTVRLLLGDEWVKVWEKSVDGLGTEIAITASSPDSSFIVSNISFGTFVAETNEKYAHFTKDGEYITADGDNTTLEGLNIVKIENLTVNVIVYDQEGENKQEVTAPTGAFNLYNEGARFTEEGVTIVDKKLSATALYPGKYIMIIDGYKPVIFTVTEDTTEYNLELYVDDRANNVSVNDTDGTVSIDHNNHANGECASFVSFADKAVTGEHYMTEFTVKYDFDAGEGWGWTQRFVIRLGMSPVANKTVGFMFFMKGNDSIQGASAYNDRSLDSRETVDDFLNGTDASAVSEALKGEGLKVRGVRNGNKLNVYFFIGTGWKPVWEKTVEGLSAYVGVAATSNSSVCTVSNVTFGEYVEATDSVAAHLVVGEGTAAKVYTLDGVETTLEKLAITE